MYVSMKEMLLKAQKEKYAVMAINCFNLESVRAVITAAEKEKSPIIINIFHEHMIEHFDTSLVAPLVKTLAEKSSVEVALNYDHGMEYDLVKQAVDDGYSSVMVDASRFDYEENIRITKELTDYAHAQGLSVEAELGSIGGTEAGYTTEADMTDPEEAKYFVDQTGIDCLAISYGSSHGDYPEGTYPELDFDRLRKIREATDVPLVLHGGSGVGDANITKSIELGICKINVGNDFMKANTKALKEKCNTDLNYLQIIQYAQEESQNIVRQYIRLSKSSNKSQIN